MADNVVPFRDGVPAARLALHHSSSRLSAGADAIRRTIPGASLPDAPVLEEMAAFLDYCAQDMRRELGGFL